jgi:hypothetical protein
MSDKCFAERLTYLKSERNFDGLSPLRMNYGIRLRQYPLAAALIGRR